VQAGVAKQILKPKIGASLVGYFNRESGATGIHDELWVRAVVLDDGKTRIALCSVETCIISAQIVQNIRQSTRAYGIEYVLIFCTHTHSAPSLEDAGAWESDPSTLIAETIGNATQNLQEAHIGAGFGALFGHSINRRWLNRPVDPSIGVLRIDSADGTPLAILGNFACHNVVLGSDNLEVSGDWMGYCARQLEATFDGVALMSQGGAGDVNPITTSVRERLSHGYPVVAIGEVSALYGTKDPQDPLSWNIGERKGGTFAEAQALASAVSDEIGRVWRSIVPASNGIRLSAQEFIVDVGTPQSGKDLPLEYGALLPEVKNGHVPLPIGIVQINTPTNDIILVTQPVETFSEDAVTLRQILQNRGYGTPLLITYANGWYGYLPSANAFAMGGYEVSWARKFGLREDGQTLILQAVLSHLSDDSPTPQT
jgi:neutral ceramidase